MVPKAMRALSIAERTEVGILPLFGFYDLFARLVKLEHEIAGGLFQRFLALAGARCQLRGPLHRWRLMIDLRESPRFECTRQGVLVLARPRHP